MYKFLNIEVTNVDIIYRSRTMPTMGEHSSILKFFFNVFARLIIIEEDVVFLGTPSKGA